MQLGLGDPATAVDEAVVDLDDLAEAVDLGIITPAQASHSLPQM